MLLKTSYVLSQAETRLQEVRNALEKVLERYFEERLSPVQQGMPMTIKVCSARTDELYMDSIQIG